MTGLQSVTAILLPCVYNASVVMDLLKIIEEADFPSLKTLYGYACPEEDSLKVGGMIKCFRSMRLLRTGPKRGIF